MFLHPLGLLALLGVPAVLALHLFRRRFRPRVVSAAFLWREEETPLAGRRRERLRRSPSLWCELAAAAALGLLFGGPRGCAAGSAEHLVVVLDASASMGAELPEGSPATRARRWVEVRIDELSGRSRVTLIQSGRRPRLLAGPAAFPAEARARLSGYEPSAARHALSPAVALGLQLAGGGTVAVVTDHFDPEAFPPSVELVSLGAPADNLAITHATRVRSGPRERVLLTLTSLARAPRSAELVLRSETAELARRTLELAPGAREHLALDLPEGVGAVEAALGGDALAIDDLAFLAPLPPRTLALGSALSPEATALLGLSGPAGARGAAGLGRLLATLPESTEAASPATAHLWLAEAPAPAPAAGAGGTAWSLVFPALGAERRDLVGPFLAERRHALLEGTTLQGVVWSADPALRLPGTPLVSAGDLPLLTEERVAGGARVFRLNLDPRRSSLQLSPDWPILLANLAELRRAELPGPRKTNLAVGEELVYRGRSAGTYVLRELATGAMRTIEARETLVADGLERPGPWALELAGAELCRLGVSFLDAQESDLTGLRPGVRPAATERARRRAVLNEVELGLLALCLGLVLLDWWVLRPAPRPPALEAA